MMMLICGRARPVVPTPSVVDGIPNTVFYLLSTPLHTGSPSFALEQSLLYFFRGNRLQVLRILIEESHYVWGLAGK